MGDADGMGASEQPGDVLTVEVRLTAKFVLMGLSTAAPDPNPELFGITAARTGTRGSSAPITVVTDVLAVGAGT